MYKIKKVEVTTGVYWIEVAEADLYAVCGCPADTVKHLMKQGLIVPLEHDRHHFETGPNAILLSDVFIQNGEFSNLCEFPVLQMLYRQGMILPGHPGNTGRRPLLIGSRAQVDSQIRYFHRGNYGLVSMEEMLAAGMSRTKAKAAMRLKLKFAFGRIRPTEELFDTVIAGPRPAPVRGGVTVTRVRPNVFEFAYKGETAEVDLNLPAKTGYPAPYPLGFTDPGREYFRVVHSGDGDGWDVNRPCMAAVIMHQGQVYLIDAGPNALHSLTALGVGVNEVDAVFHTHAHDDHFCGLATLMRADHRIVHYATAPVRASVVKKWAALVSRPESEFADYFDTRTLPEGRWFNVDGLEVKPVVSPHPVETTIFYFRAKNEGGYRTYAHLADITSRRVLDSFVTGDPDKPGIAAAYRDKIWRNYLAPADVKKIDIGGGLIHGEAEDFHGDASAKIILSHTALPLTDKQKEIGSGASFGMTDTLIAGEQDFLRSKAFHFLGIYLPGAKPHELRLLMNSPMVSHNPETILIKRGENHRHIHLIVTGVVERIDSDRGLSTSLPAGVLAGELSGLTGIPSPATYRAKTFVRALRLPRDLFQGVLADNNLLKSYCQLLLDREFLQQTPIFGESLSAPVHGELVKNALKVTFLPGEIVLDGEPPHLYVVIQGEAALHLEGVVVERLGSGDIFGEGWLLGSAPCLYAPRAQTLVQAYAIPGGIVRAIPVVRWKLYETYKRRMAALVDPRFSGIDIFKWREAYAVGLAAIDEDHKRLLAAASRVDTAIRRGEGHGEITRALVFLDAYAREHFKREERLFRQRRYPALAEHRRLHKLLIEEIAEKTDLARNQDVNMSPEFMSFLKEWVLDHILTEDRKFVDYLGQET
ncbi:MAG: bacteriohemerythrin [Desulfovibrionaceae bacterium]|nr:bacteriohemerythrin [Desulfovibrionaceae bacterium]